MSVLSEIPHVVYGRLLEAVHISGYSASRACDELEWLLEADRWKSVGPGFNSGNEFIQTINLAEFRIAVDRRKKLAKRLAEIEGTQRAIAKALGVNVATVNRDVANATNKNNGHEKNQSVADATVANATPSPLITQSGSVAAEQLRRQALKEQRREEVSQKVFESPVVPSGQYSTIVIDPPWSYSNKSGRHGASVNADYIQDRTMTLAEVADFDIKRWLAENCHLYLWVTDAYVGQICQVVEAWGFVLKATLVWVKDRFGMGNYYRHQHELCIFAVKGSMWLKRMNASTVFNAKVTKHSEKPDEFYRLVESCSPGPFLDVFARKKRAGWDVFGDEVTAEYQGTLDGRRSVRIEETL